MTDPPPPIGARAGFWIALAVAGQSAALGLIDAGPIVRYQHYAPLREWLTAPRVWLFAALVAQTLLVIPVARILYRQARPHLRTALGPVRATVLIATVVLTSATLSREPTRYLAELVAASTVAFLQIATVIVAVWSLRAATVARLGEWWRTWLGDSCAPGAGPDRFVWLCAGLVVISCIALVYLVYQAHPHVPDEVTYMLHGRYFADGRLSMPLPPVPSAFSVDIAMFEPDRWYSPVPPGWPAVLSLGFLLGNPWLVNPVLAGCNIILAHLIVASLYDRSTARLVVVLLTVSPWHLFMAMSVMPHTLTLTCALGASASVVWLKRTGRWWWAVIGGMAIGWVSLIRPLESLAVAGLLGLWTLVTRPWRRGVAWVTVLAASAASVAALQLLYNHLLTGDATTFPIMAYTEARFSPSGVTNALGFGADRGLGWSGLDPLPGHALIDVVINTNLNLFALNIELFGWLGGGLTLVMIGALTSGRCAADRFMVASVVTVIGIHALYWFAGGPDFGPRYWYLVIVPCLILAARGVQFLGSGAAASNPGRALAGLGIILCVSVTTFLPWRSLDKYRAYRGMQPGVERLVSIMGNGIVFVNTRRHPDYHSAVLHNPVTVDPDHPVFVRAPSPAVADSVLDAYPGRQVWIVDGPSLVDRGFQIRAGPITSAEFRDWGTRVLVYQPPPVILRPRE